MKKFVISFVAAALFLSISAAAPAQAVGYSLNPPRGQLSRGETVQVTVGTDVQGENHSVGVIGITYDTNKLQYVSASPASSTDSIDITQPSTGKLLVVGKKSSSYITTGTFAILNFTIIADESGSTEICAAFSPSQEELQSIPTSILSAEQLGEVLGISTTVFAAEAPTSVPGATAVSSLPQSGTSDSSNFAVGIALMAFMVFGAIHFYKNK